MRPRLRLRLKVTLFGVEDPKVWREITIPDNYTFEELHFVIQMAFGWENCHQYEFSDALIRDKNNPYTISFRIAELDFRFNKNVEVSEPSDVVIFERLWKKGDKISYVYDLGDYWIHQIEVLGTDNSRARGAHCVAGEGACPPEDCGGIPGFAYLKEICRNAGKSKEAKAEWQEYLDWMGHKSWSPEAFSVKQADRNLSPTR